MSLDPDAVRAIRARELLDSLNDFCTLLDSTHPGVSSAMRQRIAALKHRLTWCDECYSLRRRQLLLQWVIRSVAKTMLRIMETSFCVFRATGEGRRYSYDSWTSNPSPATGTWAVAGPVGERRLDIPVVSVAARRRSPRGEYCAAPRISRSLGVSIFPVARARNCWHFGGPRGKARAALAR